MVSMWKCKLVRIGVWTREVWIGRIGDRRVVDKGCVYIDAFDKGMNGRTLEDMFVELNSIFEDLYMPNVQMICYFCCFFVSTIMAKS